MRKLIKNLILLLVIFLPLYSFLRAIFLYFNLNFFLVPFSYLRDIIILIILMLSLIYLYNKTKKINLRISYITFAAIILLFNYILGFIISIYKGYYVIAIKSVHISIIPILLYFAIVLIGNLNKLPINLFRLLKILGLIIISLGFYFHFFKPDIYLHLLSTFRVENYSWAKTYARMTGIFFQPNSFAAFSILIALIAINDLKVSSSKMSIFLLILSSISIILSLSRGAWLAFIVAIAITYYIWNSKYKFLIYFIKGIFVMLILLSIIYYLKPATFNTVVNRMNSLNVKNGEAYERSAYWKKVADTFWKHPLGHGIGIGAQITYKSTELEKDDRIPVIDGFYIKTIAETGIIGILSLSFFILLSIVQLQDAINKTKKNEEKAFHILVLGFFLGMLVQSIGSNVFDFINIAPYIWLLLGVSDNLYYQNKSINL